MYAAKKEAFLAYVSAVLDVMLPDFLAREFYARHARMQGSAYADLDEEVTEDWGHKVADDALFLLRKG